MKEQLESRLAEINAEIQKNIDEHNEIVKNRDAELQMKIAQHNMLLGRRDEIAEQLAKLEQPAA